MKQARAFAFGLWTHHRKGFTLVGFYIVVLSLGWQWPHALQNGARDMSIAFAFSVVVPLTIIMLYLTAVFCYGFAGDLAGRDSLFPPRLFTLPVRTRDLVAWPMLFGCLAMASLWMITDALALRPAGIGIPVVWPAFVAATFLVWCQVLMWTPFPVRGIRVALAVVLLAGADACGVIALTLHVRSSSMIACFAPQIPLAFFLATHGVRRARRGDSAIAASDKRAARAVVDRAFKSPHRAQLWIEWKHHGMALPYMVIAALPFELATLFIPGNNNGGVMWLILEVVIATPIVLAAIASGSMRRSDTSTFIATRPVATATLASIRMQIALLSALLTWTIAIIATATALWLSGSMPLAMHELHGYHQIASFALVVMIILTWRLLLARSAGLRMLAAILIGLVPVTIWVSRHPAAEAFMFDNMKWAPGVIDIAKIGIAMYVAVRLHDEGLVMARVLITFAAAWSIAVLVLRIVLVRVIDTPHIPAFFITTVAILVLPLGQILRQSTIRARARHA